MIAVFYPFRFQDMIQFDQVIRSRILYPYPTAGTFSQGLGENPIEYFR